MSLGLSPRQSDLFATTTSFCESRVAADSIYGLVCTGKGHIAIDPDSEVIFATSVSAGNAGDVTRPPRLVCVG